MYHKQLLFLVQQSHFGLLQNLELELGLDQSLGSSHDLDLTGGRVCVVPIMIVGEYSIFRQGPPSDLQPFTITITPMTNLGLPINLTETRWYALKMSGMSSTVIPSKHLDNTLTPQRKAQTGFKSRTSCSNSTVLTCTTIPPHIKAYHVLLVYCLFLIWTMIYKMNIIIKFLRRGFGLKTKFTHDLHLKRF